MLPSEGLTNPDLMEVMPPWLEDCKARILQYLSNKGSSQLSSYEELASWRPHVSAWCSGTLVDPTET